MGLLLTAWVLAVGAVVSPLGSGVAVARPSADFDWAPKPVVAGTLVTFRSTSTPFDVFTPIVGSHWDFDGDRGSDDEDRKFEVSSPDGVATAIAPAPGTWRVTLRVEDIASRSDTTTKRIAVEAASPPPPPPPPDPPPPPPDPPPTPPPNQPPDAAFVALPDSPLVREEVTFVSYSDDRDGRIAEQAWDMNGDGTFDDVTGPVATHRFSAPGERTVTLRVTDDKGAASTLSRTVVVREPPAASATGPSPPGPRQLATAPTPTARLLSPFPIVRLVGSVTQAGTRIRLLAVRAPRGAQALVRCRGRGCPVRRAQKLVGGGPARFAVFQRRLLAHVVLEVFIRRGDRIGKYTRFRLLPNRLPQRTDGCLWPGATRMTPCPKG